MPDEIASLDELRARLDRLSPPPSGRRALRMPGGELVLGERTLVMGILNTTPDSFSGDGVDDPAAAVARGRRLVDEGADILDVGGESSRPGSDEVLEADEIRRVLPVIERLAGKAGVPISIDTRRARVARLAVQAGACMVNDITGLRGDPVMAEVVAAAGVPVVAMHMLGTPKTMQLNPTYRALVPEVAGFLARCVEIAIRAGIPRDQVILDPGIGFGKTLQHNLELLRAFGSFRVLGQPLLIGTSRKAFIGRILGGLPPASRVEGTAATCVLAVAQGVDIVRVHDVQPIVRAIRLADAVVRGYRE